MHISNIETTDVLEAMKANVDDQYKLMELKTQEYQAIITEYKDTWDAYHVSSDIITMIIYRREKLLELLKITKK